MLRRLSLPFALLALACAAAPPSAGAMDLARLMAPTDVCSIQTDLDASVAAQEQAMRCMTNYARRRMGERGLGDARDLDRSARDKSDDIIRCDSFSHYACGRQFTFWMQRVGYIPARCWRAGENIAWGVGKNVSVRDIFRAWIHSPEHRENILGSYGQIGVGLAIGRLGGRADVHVWTQHFGSHCGKPRRSAPVGVTRLADAHVAR